MQKLEELIRSMDRHEAQAFRKGLITKALNGDELMLNLFDKLAAGVNLSEASIDRYLQTGLVERLEDFFASRHLRKQPFAHDVLKMQAMAERDCYKSWHYLFHEFSKNNAVRNAEFHFAKFQVNESRVSYEYRLRSRKHKPAFAEVMHHLDAYYLSKKLQLCCEIVNQQLFFGGDENLTFIDEVQMMAQKFQDSPAVRIYDITLSLLTKPDNDNLFSILRTFISENARNFPAKEINEIYFYVKNYCIRKINSGDTDYYNELFLIYREILDNKQVMKLDYLSQFEFKNIVSLALRLKEFDWCKGFIKRYINHLRPDERKNAFTYNMAYFHFISGNFRETIRLLREVEFTDVVYQLDSRIVLLKCYYELREFDAFYYHASAFRLFLLRNKNLSDRQKTINRNLIKYLTALSRNIFRPKKLRQLHALLKKEKNVADMVWLLKKYEEVGC